MLTFDLGSHMLPFDPKFDSTVPNALYSALWGIWLQKPCGVICSEKTETLFLGFFHFMHCNKSIKIYPTSLLLMPCWCQIGSYAKGQK